ncbi:hypothetical protein LQ954_04605 [Sphingomonas sp. IC-11]|uniref:hypothetical protein n=1 Tax=Sphingomonas sp. IC-11 TaxID=2898528 RepID=UPI001E5DE09A|nr:hypothetical protein [Sphingomonas sp. IC-11]MCD2315427.1 hypothetical protein [Sphingomonas sp. IC-11]
MTRIAILIGAVALATSAVPASAAPEPSHAPTPNTRCTEQACFVRAPATCTIDRAQRSIGTCEHSARDVEELGRRQLDQLIASLN